MVHTLYRPYLYSPYMGAHFPSNFPPWVFNFFHLFFGGYLALPSTLKMTLFRVLAHPRLDQFYKPDPHARNVIF
jgi:hypothetical protein